MIDIHCHILPDIDDGAPDLKTTMEMLSIAAGDGITHIVATPHYRQGESPTIQDINNKVIQVQAEMIQKGMTVKLLGGADIRLTYELLKGIQQKSIPTINNSRYFLLELPDIIPPHLDEFIFETKIKGFVPVITHPERNYSLLMTPGKTDALREAGALFQLTAMSVTGNLGRQIKKFTLQLFRKGYVDFVATDAHSARRRAPLLSKAYKETSDMLGKTETDMIFFENPRAVIENREMP
jgi:protein-tyrosine phosphatase